MLPTVELSDSAANTPINKVMTSNKINAVPNDKSLLIDKTDFLINWKLVLRPEVTFERIVLVEWSVWLFSFLGVDF